MPKTHNALKLCAEFDTYLMNLEAHDMGSELSRARSRQLTCDLLYDYNHSFTHARFTSLHAKTRTA